MENSYEQVLSRALKNSQEFSGYFDLNKKFTSVRVYFNPDSGKQGAVVAVRPTGEWVAEPIAIPRYTRPEDRLYRPDVDYNNGARAMAEAVETAMNELLEHAYPIEIKEARDESSS